MVDWYVAHPELPLDGVRAAATLKARCQNHEVSVCTAEAAFEGSGHGINPYENLDIEDALMLFGSACKAGDPSACSLPEKAATSYREACGQPGRGDTSWECYSLGLAALHGIGTTQDLDLARRGFEAGCKGKFARACQHLRELPPSGGSPSP